MIRDRRIPDLLSVKEAADLLGMSRQALHKAIDKGRIPAAAAGGTVVLRRQAVDDFDPLTGRVEDAMSEGTLAAVATLADCHIERRYGRPDDDVETGAAMLAAAAVEMDLHRIYVEINGNDHGLKNAARGQLRVLLGQAMDARRCQCSGCGAHRNTCAGHFEHDVPEIGGRRLCGDCHHQLPGGD